MGNTESEPTAVDANLRSRGISRMHPHIQRKLRQGTGFNMKIVIRGARETGKTSLLRRLEGKSFVRDHKPTPQIQVAHIDWNYKTTSDLVQVEVWDVVDKGIATSAHDARIRDLVAQGRIPSNAIPKAFVADASTIDVYKKSNAVLMIMDPTRKWTFEYVQNEIKKVPTGCQVLLMSNFRDLHSRRQVAEIDIENFLRECDANVNYIECCMMNGYGLKQLYNWLNIPFLKLKLETLQRELELAGNELKTAKYEAQLVQEQDYDSYLKLVNMQMALQKRPPIPAQGPIPTTKRPGSKQDLKSGSPARKVVSKHPKAKISPGVLPQDHPGRQSKRVSNAPKVSQSNKRMPPKQAAAKKPSRATVDEDDLDNFNPGELKDGFFEDDDDDPAPEPEIEGKGENNDSEDEEDDDYIAPDNDDEELLDDQEAIQANVYTQKVEPTFPGENDDELEDDMPVENIKSDSIGHVTEVKKKEDDEEMKIDPHNLVENFPNEKDEHEKEDDEDDLLDDQMAIQSNAYSDKKFEKPEDLDEEENEDENIDDFVPPAIDPLPKEEEEEEDEKEEDEIEEQSLEKFSPTEPSTSVVTKANKRMSENSDGQTNVNFVAPASDSLKGFYSDDDGGEEDDEEKNRTPNRSRFEEKEIEESVGIQMRVESKNEYSNFGKVDMRNDFKNESEEKNEYKDLPVGAGTEEPGEYGQIKEFEEVSEKPKKKKKKKKKAADGKEKKKKKKKKKEMRS